MALNIGKLISRHFQYVESELSRIANICRQSGAILKVILENAYLTDDLKIIACKICKRTEVDFAKTSTAFAPAGYTPEDLKLMVRIRGGKAKVKPAGALTPRGRHGAPAWFPNGPASWEPARRR
jgi:deoxyribose-phosphate aldolase